ncbi:MAG TPA: VWA domain-containing protein [Spirochaetia bacterium]|nr:VWA domain-containing protein [Spirochaetia bacterium]
MTRHGQRLLAITILLTAGTWAASALTVSIAQIDSTGLLIHQSVNAYVSVTDDAGEPVTNLPEGAFSASESADGVRYTTLPVLRFEPSAGANEGICFLLLIDNSGSMYDAADSTPTSDPAKMKITHAKAAVRAFLASMTNPRDKVGLVVFNTRYRVLARPTEDKERIASALDQITKPVPEEAYTELYASLKAASQEFAGIRGRKAIIVLSDGENYPYFSHTGKPHPEYGRQVFSHTESITANQEEGVTVYGIDYGKGEIMDRNLRTIAQDTGGRTFEAARGEDLSGVYEAIHRQVAGEYLVSYRASTTPAEKKYLQMAVKDQGNETSATRFYFSSVVFGLPLSSLSPALVIPFVVGLGLLWLLTFVKLERRPGPANLEVLQTRVGHPMTRILPLSGTKTIIGGSRSADLTIVGSPQVKQEHATILFDPKDKSYTVVGSGDITVNNQPVKTRKLEPGDVIDVGGATIVFDDSKDKKQEKP